MLSSKATGPNYVRNRATAYECVRGVFISMVTVAVLLLALSYFLNQMLSVYCVALMKRAHTFYSLWRNGRDGLISIAWDGDSGLWFPGLEHVQHFPLFFPALQTEMGCCLCADEYTPQSLWQFIPFSLLLSHTLYPSLSPLFPSALHCIFLPQSVERFKTFIVLCMGQAVQAL